MRNRRQQFRYGYIRGIGRYAFCIVLILQCLGIIGAQAHELLTYDNVIEIKGSLDAFEGPWDIPPEKDIRLAFNSIAKNVESTETLIVKISSEGGYTATALWMADFFRWLSSKGVHVVTSIPYQGDCYSSCLLLFSAGDERFADSSARFGFHRAHNGVEGDINGIAVDQAKDVYLKALARADQQFANFIENSGALDSVEVKEYFASEIVKIAPDFLKVRTHFCDQLHNCTIL